MQIFLKKIEIIGINPYVEVPEKVLEQLFKDSGKSKGPITVHGTLQGKPFKQTVVKYQGIWRLYLNTAMREASRTKVGDSVTVALEYDDEPREVPTPAAFAQALKEHPKAQTAFDALPPYRQKEILRYLGFIKTDEVLEKNIEKTIDYLLGKEVDGALFR